MRALERDLVSEFNFLEDQSYNVHTVVETAPAPASAGGAASSVAAAAESPPAGPCTDPSPATSTPMHGTSTTVYEPRWFRQFVHASGAAFVRIDASGAQWLYNNLPPSRLQVTSGALTSLVPWITLGREESDAALGAPAGAAKAGGGRRLLTHSHSLDEDDVSVGRKELFRAIVRRLTGGME